MLEMNEKVRSSMYGVCWDCHAPLDLEIEHCRSHERGTTGVCGECSHRYRARVEATCATCDTTGRGPILEYALVSPSIVAFFRDNGGGPKQIGPWQYRVTALSSVTEVDVSTDPVAVELTFATDTATARAVVERQDGQIAVTRVTTAE